MTIFGFAEHEELEELRPCSRMTSAADSLPLRKGARTQVQSTKSRSYWRELALALFVIRPNTNSASTRRQSSETYLSGNSGTLDIATSLRARYQGHRDPVGCQPASTPKVRGGPTLRRLLRFAASALRRSPAEPTDPPAGVSYFAASRQHSWIVQDSLIRPKYLCKGGKFLAPRSDIAHNLLGMVLCTQGFRAEGEGAFRRAIAANGSNADAWNNLANVRKDQGDAQAAEALYLRTLPSPSIRGSHQQSGPAVPRDWTAAG